MSESLNRANDTRTEKLLVFQDVLEEHMQNRENSSAEDDDEVVSMAFFELANAPEIAFRIDAPKKGENEPILVRLGQDQDAACGQHTGGIVWETSVLLLNYLLWKNKKEASFLRDKRIVEVGAGCGLLGIGLAASCDPRRVILTETSQVLTNLEANVKMNKAILGKDIARACALDWTCFMQDARAAEISEGFGQLVVGTDVLFSPALVEPLLETLDFVVAKEDSMIYLCVQVRCAASHEKFFRLAAERFHVTEVVAEEFAAIPSCAWGPATGCHLFQLTRRRKLKKLKPAQETSSKKRKQQKHQSDR